jgi:hypothetical protein
MKIEKAKYYRNADGDIELETTIPMVLGVINQLVDTHNAKEPSDGKVVDLDDATLKAVLHKEPEKIVMADTWPDAATKEAAENPRVGDKWETRDGRKMTITKVLGREIHFAWEDTGNGKWYSFCSPFLDYLGIGRKTVLVSRGPEPKPEALREGDMFIHSGRSRPYCVKTTHETYNWVSGCPSGDYIKVGNILDLAAAVKEHGLDIPAILAAVQRGEVSVMLTKDEMESIVHVRKEQGDPNRISANQKLRKAMGGDK